MLSRIMRHPAGLVKKALGGRFLVAAWASEGAPGDPPAPPAYWSQRYSRIGLLLLAPAAPAPPAVSVALVHALRPEQAALPAQGGKASSFLSNPAPAPKVPAARA